ncbi:MAG: cobyrinate a,c-diamide synthase [Thermodesulfobacteriota bacterium]
MISPDRSGSANQPFGCVLISSPQGRSGKTIITVGLCDALKHRGLEIQPFKKGPDYIDPSWLTVAAGRSCRNLDLFLISKDRLIQMFEQVCQGSDLAVVEGAMGLYDGMDSAEHGTTAEIARLMDIPILLVIHTARMTTSIAAMVTGYQRFQPGIRIEGVILNHVSGSRHERKLRDAVEQYCAIPVLGTVPKDDDLHMSERHLGLIPSPESEESESMVERIGRKMESYLDLDRILAIAREFRPPRRTLLPPLASPRPLGERVGGRGNGTPKVRIGVIRDRVFNFYYPENFEALEKAGAEIIFMNSLRDRLPEIDGLYIGGGFPEFFLDELERNSDLRHHIAQAVEKGLPVYAECGGFMYLCRSIRWQGRCYQMVGIIPADVVLSRKPEGHGYVMAKVVRENGLFPVGLTVRGHEFHHSKVFHLNDSPFAYQVTRGRGMNGREDGIVYKNLFASYIHLHALGTPEWAEGFVALASRVKKTGPQASPCGQ